MFNGTWNEVSKTNIEEVLKKMGYNWAVRKVAIAMGMTLVIKGLVVLFRYENFGSEFQIDVSTNPEGHGFFPFHTLLLLSFTALK